MTEVTQVIRRKINESVLDDLDADNASAAQRITDNIQPDWDFAVNVEMYLDMPRSKVLKRYQQIVDGFSMFLGDYVDVEIKPYDRRLVRGTKDLYIKLSSDTCFGTPRRVWSFLKALIDWIPGSQAVVYFFDKERGQVGGQINDQFKHISSLSDDEYLKRLKNLTEYYAPVFELFGITRQQTEKWVKSKLIEHTNYINESMLDDLGKRPQDAASRVADSSFRRAVNDSVDQLINRQVPDIDLQQYTAVWKPANKLQLRKVIDSVIMILGNEYPLNWVDTSEMTNMAELFAYSSYNGDISKWDTSNVTVMKKMFMYAKNFNGDISRWDVSRVYDMEGMFFDAEAFKDCSLNDWDVSNVVNMGSMFYLSSYNQPLDKWDVSSVQNMTSMFQYSVFNQDISMWDISSLNLSAHWFASCPIKKEYCPRDKYLNY